MVLSIGNQESTEEKFWAITVLCIVLLFITWCLQWCLQFLRVGKLSFSMYSFVQYNKTSNPNKLFLVPSEMSILIKEHFNRWYSLKPYVISVTVTDIPVLVSDAIWRITNFIFYFRNVLDDLLLVIYINIIFNDWSTIRTSEGTNVCSYKYFSSVGCTKFWSLGRQLF